MIQNLMISLLRQRKNKKQDQKENHLSPTNNHNQYSLLILFLQMTAITAKIKFEEQQFEQHLNLIVKLVKFKEEICLELIQHLQFTLLNADQLSTQMFLHDEMSKHQLLLDKMQLKFGESQLKQKPLQFFSIHQCQLTEQEKTLVRRVSARILELFQSFNEKVQKYTHFQKQTSAHYRLMKPKLLRLIFQIDKSPSSTSHISQLCSLSFSYLSQKFEDQCKKLSKIIELIQNGQIHSIESAFVCSHCTQIQQKATPLARCAMQKISSSTKTVQVKHSQQHEQQKYFSKQKQKITQKLKVLRLEAKRKQIVKKQRTKFANKYYSLYQSAMDLHKGHLMDELIFNDQMEQKEKILSEIQTRNKQNSAFIKQHISNCSQKKFVHKIHSKPNFDAQNYRHQLEQVESPTATRSNVYQPLKLFDTVIENQHDLTIEYTPPLYDHPASLFRELTEVPKSHIVGIQCQERAEVKSFRITNPNKKSSFPTPKSNPNLFSIKKIGPIAQSYNFVKINIKSHNQRPRLPDISNHMFSVDEKHQSAKLIDRPDNLIGPNNLLILKTTLTKNKDVKNQQKKLKASQINRVQSTNTKVHDKIQKQQKKGAQPSIPMKRSSKVIRSESGNKLTLDSHEKGSLKSLEINYSTSISKKIKNFCKVVSIKDLNL